MKVTEVNLDFPINKTIETDFEHYADALTCRKETRYNYKLIIACSEEERKSVTEQSVAESFKALNPQCASVKVIFDVARGQHIRSPEIIKVKTNTEKLAEYLRVNEVEADKGIYDSLKEIEDNMEIKYVRPRHSFTLLKVSLRGSIGLKEKSGREDFVLDFSAYPDGLIALTGRVGAGKSTLIENCQPYPQMLTRTGKLQDHFYLRDSYRKLLYVDEEGTYYDIMLDIDGKNKSGKVKAFVSTGKDLKALKPVPECDGNVDAYSKWVVDTFGTMDLYLRTAFYTRGKTGSIPDIAYATKGEKKALFSTLIGIEGLTDISIAAREKSKDVSKEIERLELKLVDLTDCMTEDDIEEEIKSTQKNITKIQKNITLLTDKISELEAEISDDVSEKIAGLKGKLDSLFDTKADLESQEAFIKRYNDSLENMNRAEKLYAELDKKNSEISSFEKDTLTKLKAEWEEIKTQINLHAHDYDVLLAKRDVFKSGISDSINDTCPTCGQKLPDVKIKELNEALAKQTKELSDMDVKLSELKSTADKLREEADTHEYHKARLTLEGMVAERDKLSAQITPDMPEPYDITNFKAQYKALKSPDTIYIRLKDVISDIENTEAEIKHLEEVDDTAIREDIKSFHLELDEATQNKNDYLMKIGSLKEQLKSLIETEKANENYQSQIDARKVTLSHYDILDRAFGQNGIQALELEALSPEIADITNDVLETVFGGEYKVSFETLRLGSSGKLIEDFSILVETVSTGTIRPLEWVSGGEGTIIKEALYNAFSMAREKASGFSFKTKFMDEMDSAIDPDFRPKYLQMVKSVHELSGTCHTVMITHSSEIKDGVESRIEL